MEEACITKGDLEVNRARSRVIRFHIQFIVGTSSSGVVMPSLFHHSSWTSSSHFLHSFPIRRLELKAVHFNVFQMSCQFLRKCSMEILTISVSKNIPNIQTAGKTNSMCSFMNRRLYGSHHNSTAREFLNTGLMNAGALFL